MEAFNLVSGEHIFLDKLVLKILFLFSVLSFVALFVLVAPLSAMPFSSLSSSALTSQDTILFSHTIRHLSPPAFYILAQSSHFPSTVNKIKGTSNKKTSWGTFTSPRESHKSPHFHSDGLFPTHCFSWSTTALSLRSAVKLDSQIPSSHYSKIFQPLLPSLLGKTTKHLKKQTQRGKAYHHNFS